MLPSLPPDHPYADVLRLADAELATGRRALADGNEGMARVCGRRAVGTFIQAIAGHLPASYGTHAMANLRGIAADPSIPGEIRAAADRLLGGARSILSGSTYSTDPLGDAAGIINYFLEQG
jgi:hypothetical protein